MKKILACSIALFSSTVLASTQYYKVVDNGKSYAWHTDYNERFEKAERFGYLLDAATTAAFKQYGNVTFVPKNGDVGRFVGTLTSNRSKDSFYLLEAEGQLILVEKSGLIPTDKTKYDSFIKREIQKLPVTAATYGYTIGKTRIGDVDGTIALTTSDNRVQYVNLGESYKDAPCVYDNCPFASQAYFYDGTLVGMRFKYTTLGHGSFSTAISAALTERYQRDSAVGKLYGGNHNGSSIKWINPDREAALSDFWDDKHHVEQVWYELYSPSGFMQIKQAFSADAKRAMDDFERRKLLMSAAEQAKLEKAAAAL